MTESGDDRVASPPAQPDPEPPRPSGAATALSAFAVLGSLAALFQIDIPLLWFLRSHDLSALQTLGDVGERLGNGSTLVVLSLLIAGVGYRRARASLTRLGLDSLLAHGTVAVVVNLLKHLLGRPRPRLTHSGGGQWWPSLDAGLDSFPSGHTAATVAVATVLARAWPRLRWVPFAVAAWVGASRIWRGSHFPSDVVAGMVVGFLIGSLFNAPLSWWRRSLMQGILRVAPMTVLLAGLFWVPAHPVEDRTMDLLFGGLGALMMVVGAFWMWKARQPDGSSQVRASLVARALLWFGLGVSTGAPVLMGLSSLVGASRWAAGADASAVPSPATPVGWTVAGALIALVAIHGLKGLVPLP